METPRQPDQKSFASCKFAVFLGFRPSSGTAVVTLHCFSGDPVEKIRAHRILHLSVGQYAGPRRGWAA